MKKAQPQSLNVHNLAITDLTPYALNARIHSKKQISQIARSIEDFGFNNPILIDDKNTIIAGHGRFEAAKHLNLKTVPTIQLSHLTSEERKAYIIADNKLAEKAGWDKDILKIELQNIIDLDQNFDLTLSGFETPEIDFILYEDIDGKDKTKDDETLDLLDIPQRVSFGDLWKLGEHYLLCGDSLKTESFKKLMQGQKADMVFTDPPYNVKIDGHVCNKGKIKHKEFAFASGEMSDGEFKKFLKTTLENLIAYSSSGSLHYICIDWRHVEDLIYISKNSYNDFKNICVWNKQLGGMGSLYRSQHEFICIFKNGSSSHTNNIELGKHGRYRTNIWDYPGVHVSNHHKDDLVLHPTVKPVLMIADAILDASKRNGIILDCFGGSGSTLLAAEKVDRRCYMIEYDPKYCDVILDRFEKQSGIKPEKVSGV